MNAHVRSQNDDKPVFFQQNMVILRTAFYPLLLLLALSTLQAQDMHYSQFYNAPINLSPALTGVFGGDIRLMGNYRNQWSKVPVDYQSFTAVADMKFIRRTARPGFFSGGLAFNYDQAGYSKLNLVNLGLNGSYTHRLSDHFYGTFGLGLSANQRAFKLSGLTFDRQFSQETGTYLPGLPSGENFSNTTRFFIDVAAGINFRLQSLDAAALVDKLEKRSKLDFGLGIHHLNQPDQSFYEDDTARLPFRISPYAMGTLQLADQFDLIGNIFAQFQDPYREYLGMLGLKAHLNRRLGRQIALQLGLGYRFNEAFGDAFIPSLELFYNQWQAGFSYDINVSDFNVATRRRGGPEFSIRYIIRKVRPLPYFKFCPII